MKGEIVAFQIRPDLQEVKRTSKEMPPEHVDSVREFLDSYGFSFGEGSKKGVKDLAQEIWDNEAELYYNSKAERVERATVVARVPVTYTSMGQTWQLREGERVYYEMNPNLEIPQTLGAALENRTSICIEGLGMAGDSDRRDHIKWLSEKIKLTDDALDGGYEAVKQELLVALLQSHPEQMLTLRTMNEDAVRELVQRSLIDKGELREEDEDSKKSSYKGLHTIYRLPTFALELDESHIGTFVAVNPDSREPLPFQLSEIKGKDKDQLRVTNFEWEIVP